MAVKLWTSPLRGSPRGLELPAVHGVEPAALADELDLVVWVAMRAGALAGLGAEQERADGDVALVGADELVRAAHERQVLLADTVHAAVLLLEKRSAIEARQGRAACPAWRGRLRAGGGADALAGALARRWGR